MSEPPEKNKVSAADTGALRETLRAFLPVMAAEVVMSGIMVGVYALCGRCDARVVLGALIGTGVILLNFAAMIVTLSRAAADDPARGQLRARAGSSVRLLVMFVILALVLKTGRFAPLATVLPLCFMRLALFIPQLLAGGKKGAKN